MEIVSIQDNWKIVNQESNNEYNESKQQFSIGNKDIINGGGEGNETFKISLSFQLETDSNNSIAPLLLLKLHSNWRIVRFHSVSNSKFIELYTVNQKLDFNEISDKTLLIDTYIQTCKGISSTSHLNHNSFDIDEYLPKSASIILKFLSIKMDLKLPKTMACQNKKILFIENFEVYLLNDNIKQIEASSKDAENSQNKLNTGDLKALPEVTTDALHINNKVDTSSILNTVSLFQDIFSKFEVSLLEKLEHKLNSSLNPLMDRVTKLEYRVDLLCRLSNIETQLEQER